LKFMAVKRNLLRRFRAAVADFFPSGPGTTIPGPEGDYIVRFFHKPTFAMASAAFQRWTHSGRLTRRRIPEFTIPPQLHQSPASVAGDKRIVASKARLA
jgi:hypothetical protein